MLSTVVVMIKMKYLGILLIVITMTLMLTTTPMLAGSALAAKKKSSSSSSSTGGGVSTTTSSKSKSKTTTAVTHVKGVKVLSVHTVPSKVDVGRAFNLRGTVINNSTATITFDNGTCSASLSATFNRNVITEPQSNTAPCKIQTVTLKPGQQSPILSPNLSGKIYRATAPGITNATLTFKYGAIVPTSKSPTSNSYTRFYGFTILPPGATSTGATTRTITPTQSSTSHALPTSPPPTNSQPGALRLIP